MGVVWRVSTLIIMCCIVAATVRGTSPRGTSGSPLQYSWEVEDELSVQNGLRLRPNRCYGGVGGGRGTGRESGPECAVERSYLDHDVTVFVVSNLRENSGRGDLYGSTVGGIIDTGSQDHIGYRSPHCAYATMYHQNHALFCRVPFFCTTAFFCGGDAPGLTNPLSTLETARRINFNTQSSSQSAFRPYAFPQAPKQT